MGNSPVNDLLGIAVGHLFYFLVDVLPQTQGRHFLATPAFLSAPRPLLRSLPC